MKKAKRIAWSIILMVVTACTSPLPTLPPAPAETIIQLIPALRYLEADIQTCSLKNSPLPVLVNEYTIDKMNAQSADISLMIGDPIDSSIPAFQLGQDELVVIVNPLNSITSLSLTSLQGIMQNFFTRWEQIDPNSGKEIPGDIEVLLYPPKDELQRMIITLLNGGKPVGIRTSTLDDPEGIRNTVSDHPGAIGFIPKAYLTDTVRVMEINDYSRENLTMNIIAQTRGQPGSLQTTMIDCLQKLIKQ